MADVDQGTWLRQQLASVVTDPRGVDVRDMHRGWAVYYPARDAHLPLVIDVVPATRTDPARVHCRMAHLAGSEPHVLGDVGRIWLSLEAWLRAQPQPRVLPL